MQGKRSLTGLNVEAEAWKQHSDQAMAKLDDVEAISIARIVEATDANRRDAESRLFIVLIALFGVVSAVAIMAFVINARHTAHGERDHRSGGRARRRRHPVAVPVTSDDEFGTMARPSTAMIENVRSLSDSAEAIGKGNYDTPVPVRGPDDVLGVALSRMKENLRAARTMDAEQKKALRQERRSWSRPTRINVLIKEIHHRVKNNLQVVASLLRLQRATIDDERLQEVFDQSQSRVASMALIHEKLYRGDELIHLDWASTSRSSSPSRSS
ncbi:MAG: HAMP domain-containing protein [Flavobacteriales bacterium]|nr:HAMP domain-containing protein [Flavobacteriales bacterium]